MSHVSGTDTRTPSEVAAATAITIEDLDAALNDAGKDLRLRVALTYQRPHPGGRGTLPAGTLLKGATLGNKRETLIELAINGMLEVVDT